MSLIHRPRAPRHKVHRAIHRAARDPRHARAAAFHRVKRQAPQESLFATVAPSPFVPLHATTRIMASVTGANGRPLGLGQVIVRLHARGTGMRLTRPTAAQQNQGVVALLTAGRVAGPASVTVSMPGSGPVRTLKVEAYSNPAQLVRGKGAWASFSTISSLGAQGILRRSVEEHVTHLYLETTGVRFIGQQILNQVLEEAHNLGIAVIAWDYAALRQPAAEASSARATLSYRTGLGAQVDGLAGDFEQNLAPGPMQTFSQAVRQAAGPHRVYVGIIYPPQYGFHTPIATMSNYVNVYAPMDYWMSAARPYTTGEAAAFVTQSIAAIRATPGERNVPIEVISQTQNVENSSGFGLYNPPPAQVIASAKAAQADGAIGVSFYDLRTQTAAQIAAIAALRYP